MSSNLEALWQNYVDLQDAVAKRLRNGTASLDDGIAVVRAHAAFAAAAMKPEQPEAPSPPEDAAALLEIIRSAHAMMRGVVHIGSFQQREPDVVDHDATCTLILDAHKLLGDALDRAIQ